MSAPNLTMNKTTWLLLGLLSVLWGGSFFFVELALKDLPPLTVVCMRVTLAALILLSYVWLTGKRMPTDLRLWLSWLVMGFLNNLIPFTLIVWGQVYIEGGLAAILNATTPIFTVLLAHVLTPDERLTAHKAAGVVLGLIGVIVLMGPQVLRGAEQHILAELAIIGASVSYAFAGLYGRRFKQVPTLFTAAGMLTCTSLVMIPLTLIVDQPWHYQPSLTTLAAVLGLAVLSTAVAYLIYFYILSVAGATNVLLVTLVIPISAVLLGALVLGERLQMTAFMGMGLIGMGLLAVDGRLLLHLFAPRHNH